MPSNEKDDASSRGKISPEDRAEIRGRTERLDLRLKEARGEPGAVEHGSGRGGGSKARGSGGAGQAMRMSSEMIAGVVVGGLIGWGIDQWLGTKPAFFIVFLLLGAGAGMTNVVRAGMKMKTGPSDPSKGPAVTDDDDDD